MRYLLPNLGGQMEPVGKYLYLVFNCAGTGEYFVYIYLIYLYLGRIRCLGKSGCHNINCSAQRILLCL